MTNIILCGGSGTRLWPISRTLLPKQFVKLFSNKSFLIFLGVSALVILLLSAVIRTLTYHALFRFSNMRRHSIEQKLLKKYLQQPYKFFLNRNSSEVTKTILSETDGRL